MKYGIVFLLVSSFISYFAFHSPWHLILLWPAVSFFFVSHAYFQNDPNVFWKLPDGTRPVEATWLLLPYLAFARIVWEIQILFDSTDPFDHVTEKLIIARRLKPDEFPKDVALVIDLTSEFLDPPSIRLHPGYNAEPVLDAGTIEVKKAILWAELASQVDGKVLIHCANGSGRSGQLAAICLICWNEAKSAGDAIRMVQDARPSVSLNARQVETVRDAYFQMDKLRRVMGDEGAGK